jgi:hypothetical protein
MSEDLESRTRPLSRSSAPRGTVTNQAVRAAVIVGFCTILGAIIMAAPGMLGFWTSEPLSKDGRPDWVEGDPKANDPFPMDTEALAGGPSAGVTVPQDTGMNDPTIRADREDFARLVPPVDVISRNLRDGETRTIEELGVVLGAEFKETAGVSYVDVTFTATGHPTRRLATMAAGAEHKVRIGARDFWIVVASIDWERRTINVTLNPMET